MSRTAQEARPTNVKPWPWYGRWWNRFLVHVALAWARFITRRLIPRWCAGEHYPKGSIVRGPDGGFYAASTDSQAWRWQWDRDEWSPGRVILGGGTRFTWVDAAAESLARARTQVTRNEQL